MVNNNIYFISSEWIKKYYSGYIEASVDDNSLNSFILVAQSVRIQSVLGYDLYSKYIGDIDSTGTVQGVNYKYLMDNYIQNSTALWTIFEALPSLNFHLTNKALSTKSSEYGQPSSRNDVEYMRQAVSNNAQFFDARIREYITNNPAQFPEYYTVSGVNRIKPKTNVYFGGIYLPDRGNLVGTGLIGPGGCCGNAGFYLN